MNPSAAYQREIDRGQRQEDAAQRALLPVLDRIHAQLLARAEPAFGERFLARFRTQPPVRGLYLHGGVGRGKTFLIDLLHDSLPVKRKLRLHFHRFMGRIHEALRAHAGAPACSAAAICRRGAAVLPSTSSSSPTSVTP